MTWRDRLREGLLVAALLTAIAFVVGFAWLSRQPEHSVFETLAEVPVVGVMVDELRGPYLRQREQEQLRQRLAAQAERAASGRGEGATTSLSNSGSANANEWIGIGAQLYVGPSRASRRRSKTVRLAQYKVLGRRGSWLQIELPDSSTAWVDRSQVRDATPPLGDQPEPPRPLPARPAREDRLAEAIELLQTPQRKLELEGYLLWTDLAAEPATDVLLQALRVAIAPLEQRFFELYGLVPVGEPRETIVVYRDVASYRSLQLKTRGIEGVVSAGHTSGGMIGLAVGARAAWDVEATLVHEVAHLLARRAIGPSLPPWLAEGLSDHLALLARESLGAEGSPSGAPELNERWRQVDDEQIYFTGPLASLRLLAERAEDGSLPRLADLTQTDDIRFLDPVAAPMLYAQSAFFVDWLLESSPRREAFRAFLAAVADGGSTSGEALLAQQGGSWSLLDEQFRGWLIARRDRAVAAGW